jgi:hypothetical protein
MAKSDKPEENTGAATPQTDQEQPAQPARPPAQQVEIDDSHVISCYANFCRVTGSPEELIIDFGLNSQPMGVPKEPIKVSQRLIVNFYTAKRMLGALSMAVQRHEAAFGVLETDIQRRLQRSAPASGAPGT